MLRSWVLQSAISEPEAQVFASQGAVSESKSLSCSVRFKQLDLGPPLGGGPNQIGFSPGSEHSTVQHSIYSVESVKLSVTSS